MHDDPGRAVNRATELEARHYSWLLLPAELEWLNVRAENHTTYATVWRPSDELASRVLLETVVKHAREWAGVPGGLAAAPRLIIEAYSREVRR